MVTAIWNSREAIKVGYLTSSIQGAASVQGTAIGSVKDLERAWISAKYLQQYPSGIAPQFLTNDDMWYLWLKAVSPVSVGTRVDMQKAYALANGGTGTTFAEAWYSYMKSVVPTAAGTMADVAMMFYNYTQGTAPSIPADGLADFPTSGSISSWTPTRCTTAYETTIVQTAPGSIKCTVTVVTTNPWILLSSGLRVPKLGATKLNVTAWVYCVQASRQFRVGASTYDSGGTLLTTPVGGFTTLLAATWTLVSAIVLDISGGTVVTVAPKIEMLNSSGAVNDVFYVDQIGTHFYV